LNIVDNPVASNVDQRNIILARDAALPDVPPNEPTKRHTTHALLSCMFAGVLGDCVCRTKKRRRKKNKKRKIKIKNKGK
jgi:hypothetical protein